MFCWDPCKRRSVGTLVNVVRTRMTLIGRPECIFGHVWKLDRNADTEGTALGSKLKGCFDSEMRGHACLVV